MVRDASIFTFPHLERHLADASTQANLQRFDISNGLMISSDVVNRERVDGLKIDVVMLSIYAKVVGADDKT